MSNTELVPVKDYLRVADSNINEQHLLKIRNVYREVLQLSPVDMLPEYPDDDTIKEIARRLNLRIDTDESREFLRDCVKSGDIRDIMVVLSGCLSGEEEPLSEIPLTTEVLSSPPPTRLIRSVTTDSTSIHDIDCLLDIKKQTPELEHFIQSFLLQDIKMLHQSTITEPTPMLIRYNKLFLLDNGCLLDSFIRQKLHDHGVITSPNPQIATRFRLIEPLSFTEDFGTWPYDHWHGLFDLELSPHNTTCFPHRWSLAKDARIHCLINSHDSTKNIFSSSHRNQPRTTSLEAFVHDVCAQINNGQGEKWCKALREKEDILAYDDLANLQQSEWNNIHSVSIIAKKTLQAAIARERENESDGGRQRITHVSDQEDDNEVVHKSKTDGSYSKAETLASLHLIKLFFCYTLREKRALRTHGALPRLEAKSLKLAFEEMREEGFADDGLFPKMEEFFLPLTISEQELCIEHGLDAQKRRTLSQLHEQLRAEIKEKTDENIEQNRILWTYDDRINESEKCLTDARQTYLRERSIITVRTNDGQQQQQAQILQQLDRKWHQQEVELKQAYKEAKKQKDELERYIIKLEKELDERKASLKNIEIELDAVPERVDKQLIKPARGLIMYGPPGTGKSEIMSKLAKKLGIVMVGPPLAAGELNRPLVGESERILIALCQRCYRIPYAMCCVSIDEIDSLAPKRDEDSSEGKVDKISVLLSLIEGIKDVPNLMILCATNRLHMMDEAFLRRMSGKFFVGRPSSDARITILKSIPDWALQPQILDLLSIATTNFSGAAVRALTRSITVKCIATRRSHPNYRIDNTEALKLADRTAQQYQILFGSETLPRLLLRHAPHQYQLSNNFSYTGRIIVDLHSSSVRIEARRHSMKTTNNQLTIIEDDLHQNETNVQTLLERLTAYGKNRNVQLLQLIDLNLLAAQSAYDEKKVFETLKDRYDECIAYTRSMIVYDLDALVGVNKSESVSNMGLSTSSSVVNQRIYTYVRARFQDCAIETEQDESMEKKERWAVAIVREPFLLRQFCTDVQFTRTRREEEELEIERQKAEDLLKCVKCKDFYIENENKMGNCVHHDGFVYDNAAADLTQYTPTDAMRQLNRIECDAINDTERRDELERQKNKFKWICCDSVFSSGNVGGCKKGKHGYNRTNRDDLGQWRLTNNIADRLDPATIEEWEEACRTNEEYNEKWMALFQDRA